MKTTTMRLGLAALVGALVIGAPMRADASGLLLDASVLPAKTRDALRADIEKARAEVPALFTQVNDVAVRANESDAAARIQGAPLTLPLKALGPRALFPMLEMLAFDARAPRDLTPSAARALRLGLVEAVGIVRDARAVPVLGAVLDRERDEATTRAAAEALGRIGTSEAFDLVSAAIVKAEAAKDAPRARALYEGCGAFKRTAAAKLLGSRLAARPDEANARVLARALGTAGNAWAWQALSERGEEADTRDVAARALVSALTAYRGEARAAIEKAVLVVDAPITRSLLAEARKTATGDAATALDTLDRRVANNPAR